MNTRPNFGKPIKIISNHLNNVRTYSVVFFSDVEADHAYNFIYSYVFSNYCYEKYQINILEIKPICVKRDNKITFSSKAIEHYVPEKLIKYISDEKLQFVDTPNDFNFFPDEADFTNSRFPTIFTFKSIEDAAHAQEYLDAPGKLIQRDGRSLKFSMQACQQGYVRKFLKLFNYSSKNCSDVANYLGYRARNTDEYYYHGLFSWLPYSVSRSDRCQAAWKHLKISRENRKDNFHGLDMEVRNLEAVLNLKF